MMSASSSQRVQVGSHVARIVGRYAHARHRGVWNKGARIDDPLRQQFRIIRDVSGDITAPTEVTQRRTRNATRDRNIRYHMASAALILGKQTFATYDITRRRTGW
jgi:hypothetical protein